MARSLSPEQVEEFKRCRGDVVYLVETYGYLRHTSLGAIPWKPYPYQVEMLQAMQRSENVITIKSRQIGCSWTAAAFAIWLIIFHPDSDVLVLSAKEKYAIDFLKKAKFFFNRLPGFLKPKVVVNSRVQFAVAFRAKRGDEIVDSESVIHSLTTTTDSGRGFSARLVIMDEAAHQDKAEETWMAVLPTTTHGGQVVVISCITEDSFIFTDQGVRRVRDFLPLVKKRGFNEIASERLRLDGRSGIEGVSHIYDNGPSPTRQITLQKGYGLECSIKHPLWVRRDGFEGWVRAEDLVEGDFVALGRGIGGFGEGIDLSAFVPRARFHRKAWRPPPRMTEDLAYLIGLIIGDGYVDKDRVCIANIDQDVIDFLLSGPCGTTFKQQKSGYHFIFGSRHFVQFLEWLGYKMVRAKRKTVPPRMFEMPGSIITSFLSGLFDADGCARADRGTVSFVTTSEELGKQVQMLLLCFGIVCSRHYHIAVPTKRVKVYSEQWTIELNSDSSLFFERIGFRISRKQEAAKQLPERTAGKDPIPYSTHLVREIRQKLPQLRQPEELPLSKKRRMVSGNLLQINDKKPHRSMSYGAAKKILNLYSDAAHRESYKTLQRLYSEHYRWLKIVFIGESSAHTYDFCIPPSHTYFANGILTHNTPNGVNNFYHRLWIKTELGDETGFTPIRAYYKDCGYDEEWLKQVTVGFTAQQILQEYELTFLAGGNPFFDLTQLALCYYPESEYPKIEDAQGHDIKTKTYMNFTGVDTSTGTRKGNVQPDYTSIVTLNEYGVEIASYHDNRAKLEETAGYTMHLEDGQRVEVEGKVSQWHREYRGMCVIEKNGSGSTVLSRHVTPDDGKSLAIGRMTTAGIKGSGSKIRLLNALKLAFAGRQIIITDPFTYVCLQAMEDKGQDKAEAADGMFDDPVIALMLAYSELKRWGGFQINFPEQTADGRRMISVTSAEDLPPSKLADVLAVGETMVGPLIEIGSEVSPGTERLTDAVDDRENRVRPPRVR